MALTCTCHLRNHFYFFFFLCLVQLFGSGHICPAFNIFMLSIGLWLSRRLPFERAMCIYRPCSFAFVLLFIWKLENGGAGWDGLSAFAACGPSTRRRAAGEREEAGGQLKRWPIVLYVLGVCGRFGNWADGLFYLRFNVEASGGN